MINKKLVVLLKYYKGELNPFDACTLECALTLGFKDITVLAMAPNSVLESLKSLTRLGVKAVLISDPVYAGSDTLVTSLILSEALKKLSPDIIFCGRQSVDGDTGFVPMMVAKRLNFNVYDRVMSIDNGSLLLRDGNTVNLLPNTLYTFERFKNLRFFSIFSKASSVTVLDNSILNIPIDNCGLKGSKTRVIKTYESTVGRRYCKFITVDELFDVIKKSLKKTTVYNTVQLTDKLNRVLYVGNIYSIANNIANNAIKLEVDNKSDETLKDEILSLNADAVIFEDTPTLKQLAPRLAVLTGSGICADVINFSVVNGALVLTRPALSGSITADIICTNKPAFATVRTPKKASADVILSVGKGAINLTDKVIDVALKIGAEVCCSRIVADSGKLPYKHQVGLTGKTVFSSVYIALGISGAVQHTCAISSVGTVIAVNTDKNARIFDYADYGIVGDINLVLDKLKDLSLN